MAGALPKEDWHLDKKVTLGLIAAILLQTFAMGWWASAIEGRSKDIDARLTKIEVARPGNLDRLARLETEYQTSKQEVARRLDRIETKMDVIIDRLPAHN